MSELRVEKGEKQDNNNVYTIVCAFMVFPVLRLITQITNIVVVAAAVAVVFVLVQFIALLRTSIKLNRLNCTME